MKDLLLGNNSLIFENGDLKVVEGLELVKQQIIDLVITANAVFADTAYVALNNVTSNLLMEFFVLYHKFS